MSRWQILTKTICASFQNATLYVSALICLHNFLLTEQLQNHTHEACMYCSSDLVDKENENHEFVMGEWRNITGVGVLHNITKLGSNNPPKICLNSA